MAWTSPRTWSVGEVLTAALLNTHLRDNLNFLKSRPDVIRGSISAAGGVVYGNGFTVARTSQGRYRITFTAVTFTAPVVLLTVIATTGNETITMNTPTGSYVDVNINENSGVVDRNFHFLVREAS